MIQPATPSDSRYMPGRDYKIVTMLPQIHAGNCQTHKGAQHRMSLSCEPPSFIDFPLPEQESFVDRFNKDPFVQYSSLTGFSLESLQKLYSEIKAELSDDGRNLNFCLRPKSPIKWLQITINKEVAPCT